MGLQPFRLLVGGRALVGGALTDRAAIACGLERGEILAIGEAATLRRDAGHRDEVDLRDRVLLPGLVNAHSHAFQVLLRGRADDAPTFRRWVDDHMYPLVERLDADLLESSSLLAFAEMALNGITTVGEFFYVHNRERTNERLGTALDRLVVRTARRAGLRTALVRTLYDGAGHRARERFREPVGEAAAHVRALARDFAGDPFVRVLPAPHSLHGASADMIAAGVEVARELDAHLHIHLAEQRHDLDFARERYGRTPLRALDALGALGPRLVAVHGVWLDAGEWDLLGGAGGGLAYNPSANLFLGDGVTALERAVRAGVTVGLGCDGPGGNNRLDLAGEMRLAELLQRGTSHRMGVLAGALPGDPCPPFTLGTRGGARLLGFDAGELRPGAAADVIAIDPDDLSLAPRGAPADAAAFLRNLVYAGNLRAALTDAFVGGRDLVRARRLVTIPADELAERAARCAAWAEPSP